MVTQLSWDYIWRESNDKPYQSTEKLLITTKELSISVTSVNMEMIYKVILYHNHLLHEEA